MREKSRWQGFELGSWKEINYIPDPFFFGFKPGKGKVPQPGHDVPDHVRRGGQVVVGQVQRPQAGHVGQGGRRHKGQLVA